jgi:hypothetical protein
MLDLHTEDGYRQSPALLYVASAMFGRIVELEDRLELADRQYAGVVLALMEAGKANKAIAERQAAGLRKVLSDAVRAIDTPAGHGTFASGWKAAISLAADRVQHAIILSPAQQEPTQQEVSDPEREAKRGCRVWHVKEIDNHADDCIVESFFSEMEAKKFCIAHPDHEYFKQVDKMKDIPETTIDHVQAYSCAKRAADPSNEFAACLKWCGNSASCPCSTSAQVDGAIDHLTALIRKLLNSRDAKVQALAESLQKVRADFESTPEQATPEGGQLKPEYKHHADGTVTFVNYEALSQAYIRAQDRHAGALADALWIFKKEAGLIGFDGSKMAHALGEALKAYLQHGVVK